MMELLLGGMSPQVAPVQKIRRADDTRRLFFHHFSLREGSDRKALRLANGRNVPFLFRFLSSARGDRQLQHRRVLTFREPGD